MQNLAQRIEAQRSGAHPNATSSGHNDISKATSAENSTPMMVEVEDLTQKVARLIEQVGQKHSRTLKSQSRNTPT